jgi:regulator of chromosome condensation (RCC1) repeat-containing protein/Regulator of Chromosome Condensation (RCC1) repeat protein
MWTGTDLTTGATVNAFIFSDGSYWFLYNNPASPHIVHAFDHGSNFANNVGDQLYYVYGQPCPQTGCSFTLSQVYNATINSPTVSGATLTVQFSSTRYTLKPDLTYNSAYKTTPTLAAIADSWHGTAALWSAIPGGCGFGALCGDNFAPGVTFNISSGGTLTGVSGCIDGFYYFHNNCSSISGSLTPRSDGNAYDATFTIAAISGACGQLTCIMTFSSPETFTGVAYYNSTTQLITIAGINATTAQAVTLTGQAGPGPAAKLVFQVQPTSDTAGTVITPAIQVALQDAVGNRLNTATNSVTLAIGTNSGGGTLSGTSTVAAVGGVATFSTLSVDKGGNGYTLVASAPGLTGTSSTPFNVFFHVWSLIGAGDWFTHCGLTTAGVVYCWSSGIAGNTIAVVSGGLTFRALSVGYLHTCGLTSTGGAYCWGDNSGGELGDGTTTGTGTPVAVSGGLTFQAVSAGLFSTCGLTTAGAAYCWGRNGFGQLGNGTTTDSHTPVPVSGGHVFTSITTGGFFTCGVTGTGAAYCWGDNATGELGDSTTTSRSTPVAVSGGLTFQSISASVFGGSTSLNIPAGGLFACGVTIAGAAYCWGSGALGNGTTSSATPVAVSGGLTFQAVSAGTFTQSAGGVFACGVTTAGAAYCWGDNSYGQFGDGSVTRSGTPVAVSGGLTFQSISAGDSYTCGVTTTGAGYCWGYYGTNVPVRQ